MTLFSLWFQSAMTPKGNKDCIGRLPVVPICASLMLYLFQIMIQLVKQIPVSINESVVGQCRIFLLPEMAPAV